jgi:diguanylate cyclase (GGDEF)-like protein
VGRWGGEEFLVILPETEEEGAQVVAERIRETLAEYSFSSGNGLNLSCSIGIATYPTTALLREQLMAAADRHMYVAKHQTHQRLSLVANARLSFS